MTEEETLRIIAMAVTERNVGWQGQTFREEHEHCELLVVRLALMKILSWLEYLGRRNRSEPFRVVGSAPLGAIRCVLKSGGDLSQCFEMKDDTLDWRAEISDSARTAAAQYVRENLKIVWSEYTDPRSDPRYRP